MIAKTSSTWHILATRISTAQTPSAEQKKLKNKMNKLLLGCIADDFTGASDLANTLSREGMRTTQYIDTPDADALADCEAAIISLKSRSIDADYAIRQSLNALAWLRAQGATQFLFKYCSTFDSTPEGNIGPVAEALAAELDTAGVVVCPAFPTTGRTVYQGHLFVNDQLLNESGLQNHPLNPMTDADIRRWLQQQCKNPVGHIAQATVTQGTGAVKNALTQSATDNQTLIIVDATADQDLITIGSACLDAKLITGGSGIALGLPENFRKQGLLSESGQSFRPQTGPAVILAGSCSTATREQIEHYSGGPKINIDIHTLMADKISQATIINSLPEDDSAALVYSSATPEVVKELQSEFGTDTVAGKIESFFATLASQLVARGYKRMVVAGGETSGAVVSALNINAFDIGAEIDPGVPTLSTKGDNPIAMALKSGNFGSGDFFAKALQQLETA